MPVRLLGLPWDGLPAGERPFDYVAPEELALAVRRVVSTACGMHRKEIPPEVVHLFGYSRIGEQMAERIDALIGELVAEGRLEVQGAYLVVAGD